MIPSILNPAPPVQLTPEEIALQKVQNDLQQQAITSVVAVFTDLATRYKSLLAMLFYHPTLTPQQAWDALGVYGADFLRIAFLFQGTLNQLVPGTAPNIDGVTFTPNADGTVTVTIASS